MTTLPLALITGALGFCGRHLAAHLDAGGYSVHGLDQIAPTPLSPRERGGGAGHLTLHVGDIRDLDFLSALLRSLQPATIFHLAALTAPQAGWDALYDVNVRGTCQLLEAVRLAGLDPVILVIGSSAAYGAAGASEIPIVEEQPFRPRTAYAASKAAQELLAFSYHARYGLRIVRARPFNLTGPGESAGFVSSAFAQQIARIEAGLQAPDVEVGSLDAVRDFSDVRDAVRAYRLLAERGLPGEVYNVCSGIGTPISSILEHLLVLSRVHPVAVRPVASRVRLADVPMQVGCAARLSQATGWQPVIPLSQTLQDVLDSWRQQTPPRSET